MTETNARSTINFFFVIGVFMYLACSVGQLGGIQVPSNRHSISMIKYFNPPYFYSNISRSILQENVYICRACASASNYLINKTISRQFCFALL